MTPVELLLITLSALALVCTIIWFMLKLAVWLNARRELRLKSQGYTYHNINGEDVWIQADDDMAKIVAEVLRTGKPHVGNRTEHGFEIKPLGK